MQDSVKLFVKSCAEIMDCRGPIYEFGALQVPGQEGYADIRQYFQGIDYVGCDMRAGAGVDRIENLEDGISIEDGVVPTVLCLETLEHIFDVFKAVGEMKRVVRKDEGILILSSLFDFAIHAHPFDYWRFTPECFLRLLSDFDVTLVAAHGDPASPRSVFGIGVMTENRDRWREVLSNIANKFQIEIRTKMRYGSSPRRKLAMAFYQVFQNKKYKKKINKTKITWSISEKS